VPGFAVFFDKVAHFLLEVGEAMILVVPPPPISLAPFAIPI